MKSHKGFIAQCKFHHCHKIKADFESVGLELNERSIKNMETIQYQKNMIKKLSWNRNMMEMKEKKRTHKKVNHIEYDGARQLQKSLLSNKFDNQMCSLLMILTCRSANTFKYNFNSQFGQEKSCNLSNYQSFVGSPSVRRGCFWGHFGQDPTQDQILIQICIFSVSYVHCYLPNLWRNCILRQLRAVFPPLKASALYESVLRGKQLV